ncbi:hypothetical protein [Rhizobium subbaraonis]|uniref:hypothetical protein n=1 Tax=Rhizobium subbaraonis TaxID=908946 RepID=UPI0011429058|nr:hypothetical protein [Rhizobium subbaraonis]
MDSEIDVSLARLRSFRTWKDNWDGDGAPAPSSELIDTAIELFALLVNTRVKIRVHVGGDGRPVFFLRDVPANAEVAVEAADEISFSFDTKDKVIEEFCIPFNGKHLPEPLRKAIAIIQG